MPRPLRTEFAGAIHHVTARGVNRAAIFREDSDRHEYLALLGRTIETFEWLCMAYCLMGNHVHLLIETPIPNLADGMQRLHGTYAAGFNDRGPRSGHLFQGRYHPRLVRSDAQLFMTAAYIALNPVEAGLTNDPARYPWSSHGAMAAWLPPPWLAAGRLFAHFAEFGGDGARNYRAFVGDR